MILFFGLFFFVILAQAFRLQVLDQKELLAKYSKQILRERKVYPNRGNIFDRSGNPLAINRQTYGLFAVPEEFEDFRRLRAVVKKVPGLKYSSVRKKLKKRKRFTWLARKIHLSDQHQRAFQQIKGIYVEKVPERFYPNGALASQILGFVGVDNKGLGGVEHSLDRRLRGRPKAIRYIKDAKGRSLRLEVEDPGIEAKDVHLTIGKDLQAMAEKFLHRAVKQHKAKGGGIGAMDAHTGEILAMANYPTFDPNHIRPRDLSFQRLPFITDPFEPGSIMKTFTVISALEHDMAKGDTAYYCEGGRLTVEGHTIREAESQKQYEWLTVREILRYSSNVGTVKMAFDLGPGRLRETFKNFGFGQKTAVALPGESRGIFDDQGPLSDLKFSNMSFGQGMATTGIQILAAYGAIANGGYLVRPSILKGQWRDFKRKRIMSAPLAQAMTEMLVDAVENGTGQLAQVKFFQVAGKTSTAQRPDKWGRYSGHTPGFVGFPVNVKNRFVLYVYLESPQGQDYYGGLVAAPVFQKLAEYILLKEKNTEMIDLPRRGPSPPKAPRVARQALRLVKGKLPDFSGLDRRTIASFAQENELNISFRGQGIAHSQSIPPGRPYAKGAPLVIQLSVPFYETP